MFASEILYQAYLQISVVEMKIIVVFLFAMVFEFPNVSRVLPLLFCTTS